MPVCTRCGRSRDPVFFVQRDGRWDVCRPCIRAGEEGKLDNGRRRLPAPPTPEEIRRAGVTVASWSLRLSPNDPSGTCRDLLDILDLRDHQRGGDHGTDHS